MSVEKQNTIDYISEEDGRNVLSISDHLPPAAPSHGAAFFWGCIYLLTLFVFHFVLGCKRRVDHSNPNKIYPRIDDN